MSLKQAVWMGLFIGSTLGGYVPFLWGADLFSAAAIVGSTVGGIIGIWFAYKIGKEYLD